MYNFIHWQILSWTEEQMFPDSLHFTLNTWGMWGRITIPEKVAETRLLPVLQTVIHCKDGLRAKIIRKDFKTYFLNPSLNDSKKQSQIAIKITI